MKKTLLALFFTFLILISLSVSAMALDALPKAGEGEFTVASIHGTKAFLTNAAKADVVEDSVYWLVDNKDAFNLKYVSFLGQLTGGCKYSYGNPTRVMNELIVLSSSDEEWTKEFKALNRALGVLKEDAIPVGISYGFPDMYANAYLRENNQSAVYPVVEIMHDDAIFESYDDSNYYSIVENNGNKYIIFQLELWPRTAVLDWFNTAINQHKDKYCIVFITSMTDERGNMYTMWNWEETGGQIITEGATSPLRSYRLANVGQPRDGEEVWKYAFSKHDNILAVISSLVTTDDIVMSKASNSNGVETALIAANITGGLDTKYGAMPLITKFSEDHKTITCYYTVPFEGTLKSKSISLSKVGALEEPKTNDSLPQIALQYNGANKAYIFGYEGNTFRPQANMTRAEACTIFSRLILGVQTIPSGYTTRFEDVKASDWFYNAIAYLDETGFFFRNKNTTYKPNEPITRAEFVELANFASSLDNGDREISFADVSPDHFYYDSIVAAAGAGLVNGYEDGTFRPDNTITRAEVVTVINRLLGLKSTNKTIDTTKLENEFVDIGTHWARLNILMASNSNVHGSYYYEKTLDGVSENATTYTFENSHISITVNKKNGKVSKIINKYTNEDINLPSSNYQFIYLTSANGSNILPVGMETEGNRIKVSFKNGAVVYLLVEIKKNYMTFEVDSELIAGGECINFANLQTNITLSDTDDNSFRINAIGMSAWTDPVNKGYGRYTSTIAKVYPKFTSTGTMGAKIGIAFGYKKDIIEYLQEIMDAIDPEVGITGKTGGAYSQEYASNSDDYIIFSMFGPDYVQGIIELCLKYGIEQVDLHKGPYTHRPGDFYFYHTETGTAKEYYEKYGKQFEDAGLETSLHTYAYYIAYDASGILSNPKWVKDLETLESYTLRKDLSKTSKNVATVESAEGFDMHTAMFYKNSRYILIDSEIILVGQGTSSGLINCTRGMGGTAPAEHKKGAVIKHLSGYFNLFCPVLGSDLFYHVADLTAKAYNEGGFSMIYMDAIDGINRHVPEADVWYYHQMFIQRIVSQCNTTPLFESSNSGPAQEWNIRGRAGAYDEPYRGYNKFNEGHIQNDLSFMKFNYKATLGWYSFSAGVTNVYPNTMSRIHFYSNFDYMGYQAIIYDLSMAIKTYDALSLNDSPYAVNNLLYYKKFYNDLRKSDYFTEEVKKKVSESPYEFKVIEKASGEYAFLETYYNYATLGKIVGSELSFKGNNPFGEQAPFIRIEQIYSTLTEGSIKLATFDENAPLGDQRVALPSINVKDTPVLKARIKGTGKDGDALLISLSGADSGRADYFVDLSFTGWQDVILAELDNGMWDASKYNFSGVTLSGGNFSSFVTEISFGAVTKLDIRLSGSSAKDARISEIYACVPVDDAVKNPTVTIGNEKMTFNTTIKAGEYLEYDPLTGKALLYHTHTQTIEEVTFTGSITNVKGTFSGTYSGEALTSAPTRAVITTGFSGAEITN